ncbi:MAG: ABC transporter permease [Gammaproteobacteria bacterium]|nr:ABC transporter permease [Gammaproteobacteria bacterium]
MPFQPVILITDALFFFLTALLLMFVLFARKREHINRPWKKVFKRTTGVVSLLVLLTYYSIALLDSMHFNPRLENAKAEHNQYSNEILSVLDVLMTPMRIQVEKTFSAPLATHLFSKEMVQQADGSMQQIYPPLKFGGAHLDYSKQDKISDITLLVIKGLFYAFIAWCVLWALICLVNSKRYKQSFPESLSKLFVANHDYPVRAIAITTGLIIIFISVCMVVGSYYHLFGTDKVGQDVFYQAIKSIRTGILIGTLTTIVMLPVAISLGAMAGYFRGWVDDVIQYLYTTLNSIPGVLLIAASILLVQIYMSNNEENFNSLIERADVRLLFLCLILGVTSWTGLCRLLRAETFKLREMEYIQAATAFGVTKFRILTRHVMPNFMHIVLITVALDFSGLVLAEAVLSYINIGVDPATNSWGNMINQARLEMARDPVVWWSLTAAFVFMFTLVLFANLFADVVRDALDPRVSGSE